MKWIQNRTVLFAFLGLGALTVLVAQRMSPQQNPTPFEVSKAQDFQSLQNFSKGNLLDMEFDEEATQPAPQLVDDTSMSEVLDVDVEPESYLLPPDSTSLSDLNEEFTTPLDTPTQTPVETDEFTRVAQLDDSFPFTDTNMSDDGGFVDSLPANHTQMAELPATEMPMAQLDLEATPPPVAMNTELQTKPVPAMAAATNSNGSKWQSNPFINDDIKSLPNASGSTDAVNPPKPNLNAPLEFFKSSGSKIQTTNPNQSQVVEASATGPAGAIGSASAIGSAQSMSRIAPTPANQTALNSRATANGRTPVMTGISASAAQKAVHHIEYGKSLARRNASFAARQEFYSALGVLAQANDRQSGTNVYSQALRNGVVALKEAEEFAVTDTESQIGIEVDVVTEGHQTKIIGKTEGRHLTATQAMQRYMAFAGQQFEIAGGENVVAGETLFCLGKLHTVLSNQSQNPNSLDVAKSMVYHRAALGADSKNYQSANELGVLLAKSGQTSEAIWLLKQSLMVRRMPQTWGNLAKLHQRAGQPELAQKAMNEHQLAMSTPSPTSTSNEIRLLNAQEFVMVSPRDEEESSGVVQASAVDNAVQAPEERKSIAEKIKEWAPKGIISR